MSIRAVRVHEFTSPETLVVDELNDVSVGDAEACIKVIVASINPVDWKSAQGKYPPVDEAELPYALGRDLMGTIEAIGSQVSGWMVGDRVCALLDAKRGGQADRVSVPTSELVRVPAGVPDDVAGGLGLVSMTAWQGLFDHGGLADGQRVLIHGGAGGVGHLAVQFAKWKGCTVYATASARDLDFVRSIGADHAIDYKAERFEEIATDLDLVFDTQGGETMARSFSTLRKGGILVSTLGSDPARAAEFEVRVAEPWGAQPNADQLRQVVDLVAAGTVRVELDRRFPLSEAPVAYAYAQNEHPRGKVLLIPD